MELDNRMVSAEWLKDKFYEICDQCKCSVIFIDRIIDEIDNAPDVEIVRCDECYRGDIYSNLPSYIYCMEHSRLVGKNDFCSYGERRTDD